VFWTTEEANTVEWISKTIGEQFEMFASGEIGGVTQWLYTENVPLSA